MNDYKKHRNIHIGDEETNAKNLEKLMSEVENYLIGLKQSMSAEEKAVLRNKLDHMVRNLSM